MSAAGWRMIQDNVVMTGTVVDVACSAGNWGLSNLWPGNWSKTPDGDWSLFVLPDDPKFGTNAAGVVNPGGSNMPPGVVECEVQPTENNESLFTEIFKAIVGHRITIAGSWVEDLGHNEKTEIHPISYYYTDAVWGEEDGPPAGNYAWWCAFSDASSTGVTKPHLPFHAGENVVAQFTCPFPPRPATAQAPGEASHRIVYAIGVPGSPVDIQPIGSGNDWSLNGNVETGPPEGGHGMWAAKIVAYWGPPPKGPVVPPKKKEFPKLVEE